LRGHCIERLTAFLLSVAVVANDVPPFITAVGVKRPTVIEPVAITAITVLQCNGVRVEQGSFSFLLHLVTQNVIK
jgi:hypothetical protein